MSARKQMLGMVSRQMSSSGGDARFFSNVERTTPVRPPDLTPDVLVPLAQMGVIGLGAFLLSFSILMFVVDPVGALALALAFFGIAAGLSTFAVLDWKHKTIYSTETFRDNLTATSQAETQTVTAELELTVTREDLSAAYPPIQKRRLPIDTERFQELAAAAISGESIAQADWVGSDKPFSRSEFDQITQTLMELGILAWRSDRDPAQGRVITAGGRHALQAIIDGRAELGGE